MKYMFRRIKYKVHFLLNAGNADESNDIWHVIFEWYLYGGDEFNQKSGRDMELLPYWCGTGIFVTTPKRLNTFSQRLIDTTRRKVDIPLKGVRLDFLYRSLGPGQRFNTSEKCSLDFK